MNLREWANRNGHYPSNGPRRVFESTLHVAEEFLVRVPDDALRHRFAREVGKLMEAAVLSGKLDTDQPIFIDTEQLDGRTEWLTDTKGARLSLEYGIRVPERDALSGSVRPSEAIDTRSRGIER